MSPFACSPTIDVEHILIPSYEAKAPLIDLVAVGRLSLTSQYSSTLLLTTADNFIPTSFHELGALKMTCNSAKAYKSFAMRESPVVYIVQCHPNASTRLLFWSGSAMWKVLRMDELMFGHSKSMPISNYLEGKKDVILLTVSMEVSECPSPSYCYYYPTTSRR